MNPLLWRTHLTGLITPITGGILFLLTMTWILQSTRFLDLILNKGLSFMVFLHLTGLLIPMLLQFILPLGFLFGVCAYLKRINDESELTPWFATGLSPYTLLKPILAMGLLFTALGYFISLQLMPLSMTAFKNLQHQLRHQEGAIFLEAGTFNQLSDGLMVYLKNRTSNYSMEGLLVHDSRNQNAPTTWLAKSGTLSTQNNRPQLELTQGIRQDITQTQVTMLEFEKHTLELSYIAPEIKNRSRSIEEYTLTQLNTMKSTLNAKQQREAASEFHTRLLWPLTPLVFTLIAAAGLLQPTIRRRGALKAVVWVSLVCVAYQLLLILAQSMAQNGHLFMLKAQWALPPVFMLLALGVLALSTKRAKKGTN